MKKGQVHGEGSLTKRLAHITRRNEQKIIRAVIDWKPEGKRPRGRTRKRWLDIVEKDLKALGVQEWKDLCFRSQ